MERHRKSVLALRSLLLEVCKTPASFADNAALIVALKSQGALAAFEDDEREVVSSSLNTVKRVSALALPGGFGELNALRVRAALLLRRAIANPKRAYGSKGDLKRRVDSLGEANNLLRRDLLLITKVVDLSMRQARRYAELAGPDVSAKCQREQRELYAFLSARSEQVPAGGTESS